VTVIGICGVGSIGTRHARVFSGMHDVTVVVHDAVASTSELRDRLGPDVHIAPSLDALLDRGVDGLVVASPDETHARAALLACDRGVAVLLEKPMADTVDAARQIAAAATSSDTPVLMGYVLRHVRCMRRALALLRDGAIGAPLSFQVMLGAYETLQVARNRFDGAAYGTLFRDYSHEWDYLRWLLAPVGGGYALARTAGALELRQHPNVVDVVLRLDDGTTGTAHLDYVQAPGNRRFTIIGDTGTLDVDVPSGDVRVRRAGQLDQVESHAETRDDAFRAQAAHFIAVAGRTVPPVVDVHDGLAALQVSDAMRRSALENRWMDVERG
jgi:predicted dehydrogenase